MASTDEGEEISQKGDFMTGFIKSHKIPQETLDYFSRPSSWLAPLLTSPSYTVIPTFSRVLKRTGEDYFFSRTVSSPQTIPHMLTLQRTSFPYPKEIPRGSPIPHFSPEELTSPKATPSPTEPDALFLIALARPGLDGHPHVIHGGMSCAILDEMLGLTVMLHHQHIQGPRDSLFTANLNVSYKRPVPTPNDILVKCWLVGKQGRKWYSIGQLTDHDGNVMTEGKGVWVMTKRKPVKI